MQAQASAYFSNDEVGDEGPLGGISFLAPSPAVPRAHVAVTENQLLVHSVPGCSEFPITNYILWDRSPLSAVRITVPRHGDFVPPLYLSRGVIDSLLSTMDKHEHQQLVCIAEHEHGVLRLLMPTSHSSPSSLSSSLLSNVSSSLSVPIRVVPYPSSSSSSSSSSFSGHSAASTTQLLQQLVFARDSTEELLGNLRAQYSTGRNYSLKSSLRIRAAGFISHSSSSSLRGTLRFEAVVPNDSLAFQRIRPVPLLSTPLSLKLTCSTGAMRQMGYLTLNKTRKVVPLLETDPAISLAPLVGVWVSVIVSSVDEASDALANVYRDPFVIGAVGRFLKDSKIRERVFVDRDQTFLLAVFTGFSTEYFEVFRTNHEDQDDFCVLDFTVDLSRGGEEVLGYFRGVCDEGDVNSSSGQLNDQHEQEGGFSQSRSRIKSVLQLKPYGDVHILASQSQVVDAEETPIPRKNLPTPTPTTTFSPHHNPAMGASTNYGPSSPFPLPHPLPLVRASLSLSDGDGTCSNRSSLENVQLMKIREIVGGCWAGSEDYDDDFEEGCVDADDHSCGDAEDDLIDGEEGGEGTGQVSEESGVSTHEVDLNLREKNSRLNRTDKTSPVSGIATDTLTVDGEADTVVEETLLAPWRMFIPTDESDFTLSRELRRVYYPTNPLASLTPCIPNLRPLGEEDSFFMETGLVGLRSSLNSSGFSSAFTHDLDEQVREIMEQEAADE